MATYSEKLSSISRTKVNLIEIILDACSLTFGVAPCTATGTKCYNTFYTCKDTPNYALTTKTYKFISANAPISVINDHYGYKPYIKNVDSLASEIKDGETIVKRLKAQFYDEDGDDFGIDPYLTDRASVQGSFWKKFIARNPNYKGRLIKLYEGFDNVATASFELKFVGKLDNIQINKGIVTVEAVDLLRSLKDIKYPVESGIYLNEAFGNFFSVYGSVQRLALNSILGDYCQQTTGKTFSTLTSTSTNDGSGSLIEDSNYDIYVVGYDSNDRPFISGGVNNTKIAGGDNALAVTWNSDASVSYYRVWYRLTGDTDYVGYYQTAGTSYTVIGTGTTAGQPPTEYQLFYKQTGADPSNSGSWTETHNITLLLSDASTLPSSGYLMVNKEIIYYSSISTNTLQGVLRGQFDTEPDSYPQYESIFLVLQYNATNPFTVLDDLLTTVAGIDAAYIDAKFATYESGWTGIDVSLRPVIKANNLAEIYFDLVNLVNCLSWVGEDGKIKIVKHTETPGTFTELTDEANLILNTPEVDLNEESRFTRWGLYWNRTDLTKGIKDSEAYNRFNLRVNADSESDAGYNESREDIQYSSWLNDDSDSEANISTHITDLLTDRETRTKQSQEVIDCEVELKDNAVLTGDIIKLSTGKLQDKDGNDYSQVQFRVMKKEPVNNRIKLKLQRRYS